MEFPLFSLHEMQIVSNFSEGLNDKNPFDQQINGKQWRDAVETEGRWEFPVGVMSTWLNDK